MYLLYKKVVQAGIEPVKVKLNVWCRTIQRDVIFSYTTLMFGIGAIEGTWTPTASRLTDFKSVVSAYSTTIAFIGASEGTWTPTVFLPTDFESAASADSATLACLTSTHRE